jgi:hypothetical protein
MADQKQEPKPADEDVENKPEHQKNVDRDGGERQPTDVAEGEIAKSGRLGLGFQLRPISRCAPLANSKRLSWTRGGRVYSSLACA